MITIAPLATAGTDLAIGTAPVSGAVRGQAVTLAHAEARRRWSLRARDAALLSSTIGHALPARIGTHEGGIARLGPDEWFAVLPADAALALGEGLPLSVVEVSSRSVGFTVSGPGAAAALMRGCPLDLARFTPGRATRTVFETVEIQIWATGPETFHVEVWRSFAAWLWHAIAEAVV